MGVTNNRLAAIAAALLMLACAMPGAAAPAQKSAQAPASSAEPAAADGPASGQAFSPAPYVLTDGGRSVVLGRYSTASSEPPPDLVEPIEAVVSLSFPRQTVRSIREAIDYALMRSGYRLDADSLTDAGRQFLDLPLPESQRQVGPYSVSAVLSVLVGSAWRAQVNRADRTVSIGLRPGYGMAAAKPVAAPAPTPVSPASSAPSAFSSGSVASGSARAGMTAKRSAIGTPYAQATRLPQRGNMP
jgi:type IV pili sensor histidine kinase/response regulator